MNFVTVASLLSLAATALAQSSSAIPEEQNVAVVEDTPTTGGKSSSSTESFNIDSFLENLLADLPKGNKKSEGEKRKPKLDFGKLLDDLIGDSKSAGAKSDGLKDLFGGDMKDFDFKSLLDGILKKPEAEKEKVDI